MKPFPSQESRVLAQAFKQLLNVQAAKELSVLEKCGERVPLPVTRITEQVIKQGSFIPSYKTQCQRSPCSPSFGASPPQC